MSCVDRSISKDWEIELIFCLLFILFHSNCLEMRKGYKAPIRMSFNAFENRICCL